MAKASLRPYQGQLSLPFELGENMWAGNPFYVYDDAGTPKIAKCVSNTANQSSFAKGYYNAACMISANIFVVVYRDLNSSNYGYVRAGRINGDNTISWGTAQQFWGAAAYYLDVCSYTADAFCVTYRGASNYAEIRAGTVHSTTLAVSLGTSVVIGSAVGYYNQICSPAAGKVCVVWKGTNLRIQVATIVGTTISTPTAASTLDTLSPSYIGLCSPDTDKIVATYYGSGKGYAIGATISGTTVTPGTRSEFSAVAVYSSYIKSPDTNKIVVVYRNSSDGYKPYARCATLVGTTFTWGTAIKVLDSPSYYQAIGVLDTDKIVFMIAKDDAPYKGIVIKATITGTTISLGTENCFLNARMYYIDCLGRDTDKYLLVWYDTVLVNSYALSVDGEVNTIPQCLGILEETGVTGESKKGALLNSITKAFSGLAIGSLYYIQCDGSITVTQSPYPIALAYKSNEAFISKTILG